MNQSNDADAAREAGADRVEPVREPESHGPPGSRREAALRASPQGGGPRRGRGGQSANGGSAEDGRNAGSPVERGAADAARPGSSNARAQTPPVESTPVPLVLQNGEDWLTLAYRLELDEHQMAALVEALDGKPDSAASCEVAREQFELRALNAAATRFRLENATKTVIVGPDSTGFAVRVEFHGLQLRTRGIETAIAEAEFIALCLADGGIEEVRVWRVICSST